MKRILVRPGKSVVISTEVAEKVARSFRKFAFTREEVERMAATEPRGMTVYAGPLSERAEKPKTKFAKRSR